MGSFLIPGFSRGAELGHPIVMFYANRHLEDAVH
jgi:hypothetical protein